MSEEKFENLPTGLYWKNKKTEVEKTVLPFQTIETINESRATREKEKSMPLLKDVRTKSETTWYNRLVWGDNKYIMASLLEEFAGKIDLIYIDPPFATGANFSVKIEVGDVKWVKEPSAIEEKAYRDTWGESLDSYLQMMYERLVLMRELLADNGTIFVHLDYRVAHYIKIALDEIFGYNNLRNEIVWKRSHGITGVEGGMRQFARLHDTILCYKKGETGIFNPEYTPYSANTLKMYQYEDEKGQFRLQILRNYSEKTIKRLKHEGRIYEDKRGKLHLKQYLSDKKGVLMSDVWVDIPYIQRSSYENLKYPTQKPEVLLERIIKSTSKKNDLIVDFFCGSGTTAAVAEKLGRRWIVADLSRFAIHTTRKRLLDIAGCKPFVVQNLGKYERQYWQDVAFKKRGVEQLPVYEYIKFILKLYNAESISGMLYIHGKKGKRLVHVGAVDSPVTLSEIQDAISEVKKSNQNALDILGWEWEMGLHDVVEKEAKSSGVKLRLFNIPRDVMDPRAVEKGDITFYELAYLEAEVKINRYSEFVVKLTDFAIPNLDLIPEEVRSKIKKWSDYIDYWAVDWNWHEDTFHNMWQSYRTRKERKLELKSDGHKYESKEKRRIMIKVIDIFGNDTTKLLEIKS